MLRKEQIHVTDPNAGVVCLLNLSEDVQTISVSHVISRNDMENLIDRLYFTDKITVVTDRTSIDMNSGDLKVITVEENDAFKYCLSDNAKFPFDF